MAIVSRRLFVLGGAAAVLAPRNVVAQEIDFQSDIWDAELNRMIDRLIAMEEFRRREFELDLTLGRKDDRVLAPQ